MDGGCGGIPSPCLDFLKTPTMYHRTISETIDYANSTVTIGSQDDDREEISKSHFFVST
jgi:hypothetical protein